MKKNNILLFLIAGILSVAIGTFVLTTTLTEEKTNTEAVSAVVTGYEEGEEYSSATEIWKTVYYPVVSYLAEGKEYTVTYQQSYSKKEFDVGKEITILYNPKDPQSFTIKGDNRGIVAASWLIPCGIVLIIISLGKRSKAMARK